MPRNDGGWAWRSPGVLTHVGFGIATGLACLFRGDCLPLYVFNNGISLDKFGRGFFGEFSFLDIVLVIFWEWIELPEASIFFCPCGLFHR
jgi:hypothetical protein